MRHPLVRIAAWCVVLLVSAGCGGPPDAPAVVVVPDPHSYAEPAQAVVEHLALDLTVDFDARVFAGRASLGIRAAEDASRIVLDTRDLDVEAVTLGDGAPAEWSLGDGDPLLGRPLTIGIAPSTREVRVEYRTRPEAAAPLWLEPRQTAGGIHPFVFTQSQAILARTWVPIQDTPGVRFTYEATVRVPPGLLAVMSAVNPIERAADGVYTFEMPQPIPSYLLALAVGDLEFRPLGADTGVYGEPSVVDAAAWEFAETQPMLETVESLYGDYAWGRYDLLVLPPSFPFGGMENPRLTFVTPTILAGDRSLVALVAHELAHSWSGNLVTNATWNDFWLNEGFTVYLERRIMEAIKGRDYSEMLALLGRQDLERELADLGPDSPDTHLLLDLAGRDPDDGMTDVAYEKGYLFLRMLEEAVGRERFDVFLRGWFRGNAFRSRATADFERTLRSDLLDGAQADALGLEAWLYGPGIPDGAPRIESAAFDAVDRRIAEWAAGAPPDTLGTSGWTTHEWLHFVRGLPQDVARRRLAELDAAFGLSGAGNSEILAAWLEYAVRRRHEPAYPSLRRFLTVQGRQKFLEPLYEALVETGQGDLARAIYRDARPGYHALAVAELDPLVGPSSAP